MKNLLKLSLIVAALGLSACAHERTEMDRELALKLVDKAGRIEIIQTMNGTAQPPLFNAPQASQAHGPWESYQTPRMPSSEDRTAKNCSSQPIYSLDGTYIRTAVTCF